MDFIPGRSPKIRKSYILSEEISRRESLERTFHNLLSDADLVHFIRVNKSIFALKVNFN